MGSASTRVVEHTVISGETLAGIAGENGMTRDALLAANPEIQDPDRIRVGQLIIIPSQAAAVPESDETAEARPPSSEANEGNAVDGESSGDSNAILFEAESVGASDGTAKLDRLPQRGVTGGAASEAMAQTDRKRVVQHKAKFVEAARKFNAPPVLLAAIASRESRGGAVLDGRGFGDHGHGFGLMQVDIGNPFPKVQEGCPGGSAAHQSGYGHSQGQAADG